VSPITVKEDPDFQQSFFLEKKENKRKIKQKESPDPLMNQDHVLLYKTEIKVSP
jgi:hypothetical protein